MRKNEEKANNMRPQNVPQGQKHAVSQAEERCYAFTPWRRLFAFFLDINLCMLIWRVVLSLALRVNLSRYDEWGLWLLFTYAAALLQFLLEPLLLHRFGATPGKAIMGIYIETESGERPTYAQALARTWKRFLSGFGFGAPILRWVCAWRNGRRCCIQGETCAWDKDNGLVCLIRDQKRWRCWALIGAWIVVYSLSILVFFAEGLPPCRGRLTVAQFARNYNMLARYYGDKSSWRLDETGAWQDVASEGTDREGEHAYRPEWRFALDEEGYIVRAELEAEYFNCDHAVSEVSFENQAFYGMVSIVRAQPNIGGSYVKAESIARQWKAGRFARIWRSPEGEQTDHYRDVSIAYNVTYQGMTGTGFTLEPASAENHARFTLSIGIGDESH